tara:strand:- start:405 stop:506 length:102 start_codon:yes stop_codon:yes gene_type:complete
VKIEFGNNIGFRDKRDNRVRFDYKSYSRLCDEF